MSPPDLEQTEHSPALLRRNQPVRTGPNRRVLGAFQGSGATPTNSPSALNPTNVIKQSVDTAYRVIEEYLFKGRNAAAQSSPHLEARNFMKNDMSNMTESTMRYWMSMWQWWMSAMAPWMGGFRPPGQFPGQGSPFPYMPFMPGMPGMPGMSSFAPPCTPWDNASTGQQRVQVLVDIDARARTAITVDLTPRPGSSLILPELVADGGGKPTLVANDVDWVNGQIRLRIVVSPNQPAGLYSGQVIDAITRQPYGAVRLMIY